jgi:hypothetical protein
VPGLFGVWVLKYIAALVWTINSGSEVTGNNVVDPRQEPFAPTFDSLPRQSVSFVHVNGKATVAPVGCRVGRRCL